MLPEIFNILVISNIKTHAHNIRIVFYTKDNLLEQQGNVWHFSCFLSLCGSGFEENKLTGVFIYFSI